MVALGSRFSPREKMTYDGRKKRRRTKRPLLPASQLVDTLGFTVNRHFGIRGGYQLAQRFTVNSKSNRIGFDLTQKGPVFGLKFSL